MPDGSVALCCDSECADSLCEVYDVDEDDQRGWYD